MEYFRNSMGSVEKYPWRSVSVTAGLTSAMFMMLFLSMAPHESSSSQQNCFAELVVLFLIHAETVLPMS